MPPRCLPLGFALLGATGASADTRSLKLLNMHTQEKAEIVFKRNGRFDSSGLRQLNQFMRDWRRNEPTKMDPRLFDLIWEAYKTSGSNDYIHVVCGYRSPQTNSMLRSRSKGVAKKSQHMLGKAMDFYIPDVKLKRLREIGLKMQGGGVGYYPSSGSPFVHFDVGNVRHWPKMSRRELIALFPDGKTLHVPSDGKPLPGFNQALASYQARKKSGNVAIASLGKSNSGSSRSGSLLAAFFGGGGGADDEEDSSSVNVASGGDEDAAAPAPQPKATAKATAKARRRKMPTTRFASCRLNSPIRSTCRRRAAGNHRRHACRPATCRCRWQRHARRSMSAPSINPRTGSMRPPTSRHADGQPARTGSRAQHPAADAAPRQRAAARARCDARTRP